MHSNNPNIFSENELDKLINQSFLESDISKPENEKITELIAAEVFGLGAVAKQGTQPKTIRKIGWQVLLLASLVITGGMAGFVWLKSPTEEPKRNVTNSPVTQEQTSRVSDNTADVKPKSKLLKKTSEISTMAAYKIPEENNGIVQAMLNDSTANNLMIRKPETIHFEDPPILFPKNKDSLSLSVLHGERNHSKSKKARKRRIKSKWREHEVKY